MASLIKNPSKGEYELLVDYDIHYVYSHCLHLLPYMQYGKSFGCAFSDVIEYHILAKDSIDLLCIIRFICVSDNVTRVYMRICNIDEVPYINYSVYIEDIIRAITIAMGKEYKDESLPEKEEKTKMNLIEWVSCIFGYIIGVILFCLGFMVIRVIADYIF